MTDLLPAAPDVVVQVAHLAGSGSLQDEGVKEATTVLADTIAQGDARVQIVIAHTLPEAGASSRVLTRCGFQHTADVVDPEDGPVWRWERRR